MRVLTVGGGSGGHVTPVRAVINELSRTQAKLEVRFVCDKKFYHQAASIMSHADTRVSVGVVSAGKLRRYHGVTWWKQLLDLPTTARNIRDIALIVAGFFQSIWLLLRWRPDVIFTKGGYVCLPVGLAAKLLSIPLVIHDSDAHPGLTNRILARWASYIATGAPLENYPYETHKSRYVGIPIDNTFKPYSKVQQKAAKDYVGLIDTTKPLVVVTGGGLGARRINHAMLAIASDLLAAGVCVYHITGKDEYSVIAEQAPHSVDYMVVPFVSERMHDVLGSADAVVTRAGATTLLELAALAKPTVIVPNSLLSGGHQLKNAAVYADARAAIIVDEMNLSSDPTELSDSLLHLLSDPEEAAGYAARLHEFARPDAAEDVARLIIKAAKAKA